MDTIELKGVELAGLRLDLPSRQQISALAYAWDDDANHQLCFLSIAGFQAARGSGEYASMVRSADLVLSKSRTLSTKAAEIVKARTASGEGLSLRKVKIGQRRKDFLSFFGPPEELEDFAAAYKPLAVLSVLLSSLEERKGSLFILGGKKASLARAEINVKATFPSLRIVGRSTGDCEGSEALVLKALQKASPDLILVGSMLRGGELWIPRNMRFTNSGIYFYEARIIETLAGIHRK